MAQLKFIRKMKIILLVLIINSTNLICQTKISEYYHNVNSAIEEFNYQEYKKALDLLVECPSDFMFEDDKNIFYRCLDSLLLKQPNIESKKYIIHAEKLRSQSKEHLPIGFLSKNRIVDNGINIETSDSKKILKIYENETFLISIINTDRFISLVRTNGFSEQVEDSLYTLFANNVLEIFKQDFLPSRLESYSWNDNLNIAISHAIRTLKFNQKIELLDCLWEHVLSGDLHAFQFAQFYDDVYYNKHGYSALGVKTEVDSFDPTTNSFVQKALPIKEGENINELRKEFFLGDLEEWYKFKNVINDFNTN